MSVSTAALVSSSEECSRVSGVAAASVISARVSADPADSLVVLFGYDSADVPVAGSADDIEEYSLKLSIEREEDLASLDVLLLGMVESSDTDGSSCFREEGGSLLGSDRDRSIGGSDSEAARSVL